MIKMIKLSLGKQELEMLLDKHPEVVAEVQTVIIDKILKARYLKSIDNNPAFNDLRRETGQMVANALRSFAEDGYQFTFSDKAKDAMNQAVEKNVEKLFNDLSDKITNKVLDRIESRIDKIIEETVISSVEAKVKEKVREKVQKILDD